ncbi:MAG: DUF1285 domain-containing protein [Gammaproteobacteria bacterium]|nr:DUF1285 domain-containing protein [Gammaproteobacteria bacterium]
MADSEGSDRARSLFESLMAEQQERKLPPVDQWQPEREGEIDIRIARDGTWYHEGAPIRREAMVRLFSTILRREGDRYWLVTPAEKLAIEVEDAPFTAIGLEQEGSGDDQRLLFTTNVGEHVLLDSEHPLRVEEEGGEPSPYVPVRGGMEALINRPTFYRLVELAEPDPEDRRSLGVRSCGQFFPIGRV